jgi:hypothetical protein
LIASASERPACRISLSRVETVVSCS